MKKLSQGVLIGGVLLGTLLVMSYVAWRNKKKSKRRLKLPLNTTWQPIGHLKNILLFPLKAGRYVEIENAVCTELGIAAETTPDLFTLRDRNFVVYRQDNMELIFSMTFPVMTSIKVTAKSANSIQLKSQNEDYLDLTIPTSGEKRLLKSKVLQSKSIEILDCGNKASDWITKVIKGDKNAEGKLRIGYLLFNETEKDVRANQASYMMMTTSSLSDFNKRLTNGSIDFKQFRPNCLIDTLLEPYSEDNWSWIKIGEDEGAIFMKIQDCGRCAIVNIDLETFKYNRNREPLRTLSMYRKPNTKSDPNMGIYLSLYKKGRIKIGDIVYIRV